MTVEVEVPKDATWADARVIHASVLDVLTEPGNTAKLAKSSIKILRPPKDFYGLTDMYWDHQ